MALRAPCLRRASKQQLAGVRGYRLVPGQYGPGGRNSVGNTTVAIFGSTGMLGRYVANQLGRTGTRCILPTRGDEADSRHLKQMFDLGMVHIPFYHPDDEESVRKVMRNADVAINLVGKHYETKHVAFSRNEQGKLTRVISSFEKVNVHIPRRLARIAKEEGVERFIHVSALAQDINSPSRWARTKALGEQAVLEEYPQATIVRPGKLYATEDRFINWIALWLKLFKRVPIANNGVALVQPTHVLDVAQIIARLADVPNEFDLDGRIVELAGESEYSWAELVSFIVEVTGRPYTKMVSPPLYLLEAFGAAVGQMPTPMITRDEVIQQTCNVVLDPASTALKFQDFGHKQAKFEAKSFESLHMYRPGGHFATTKGYH